METDSAAADDHQDVLYQWSARKVPPIVLLYVALVFLTLIAVSHFVFHSPTAVKTLAMTTVASMVPLVPTVLQKVEYRMIGRGLEKRSARRENPGNFEIVLLWDEVDHVVLVSHGFKFYKPLCEPNPVRRFWKLHVSDEYSGEVHVGKADQDKVFELLRQHGLPIR